MDDLTARDLLDAGQCSPSCLLARNEESAGCKCRCGGEYHSLLADTPLDGAPVTAAAPDRVTTVRRGDVIATGLRNGDCPVGLVESVDNTSIRLRLMSFWDGTFDTPRVVFWRQIEEILHAGEETDEHKAKMTRAMYGGRDTKIFDTEPLGKFQTYWTHRNGVTPCIFCKTRLRSGRLFFQLPEGLACARCVEEGDMYERIVPFKRQPMSEELSPA